ncbi:MAG: metallophosphoesterase [Candidatus Diapherotrites archaeon]
MKKEIFGGAKPVGLGLFFEREGILAIADLHLGYEEMLNSQGIFLPRTNFEKVKETLEGMFKELPELNMIVILGDLKHEFGFISRQEWREVIEMLQFLQGKAKKIALLKGNHDKILGPLVKWERLKIREELYITSAGVLFLHGDKLSHSAEFKKAKTIIIGHEHPAIALRDGVKSEMFKCFLKGKFKEKKLIVLPSLDMISIGTNILREKPLSPFLQGNLSDFECWLVEDKAYYFGKLKELK